MMKILYLMIAALCAAQLFAAPQVPHAIPFKEDPPIMVDGDISDWDEVPAAITLNNKNQLKNVSLDPARYGGDKDLSAEIKSAWRDYGLFLMIKVTDNFHNQQFNGKNIWRGDHAELYLDLIPAVKTPENKLSNGQFHLMLSPGNFANIKPEIAVFHPAALTLTGTKIEAAKTADGYIIEAEIPWENFKFTGSMNKIIGLDIWVSDTDEFDHQQTFGVQKSILTNGDLNRSGTLRGMKLHSLTTADGIVRNIRMEEFKPVKLKTAPQIDPLKEISITFDLNDLPAGIHPILKLQANILTSRYGLWGWRAIMKIFVNGKELTADNILERPVMWRTRDGRDNRIYSKNGFSVPYTRDFVEGNKLDATSSYLQEPFKMHDFTLDLTGIAQKGTNTIVIKNTYDKSILQIRNVKIDFAAGELRKPKRPAPTGKLPVIKPAKDFKNECTIVSNGNPLKLRNGINNWIINSSFSTPDGKWVTSGSNFFKHSRKVEKVDGGILVSD
ncbi:MAG: hypothetical protein IKD23_02875, partial [Lentisphaeria bacterium]|nr:hypothetical protein [Lentisphaeria bacterium]